MCFHTHLRIYLPYLVLSFASLPLILLYDFPYRPHRNALVSKNTTSPPVFSLVFNSIFTLFVILEMQQESMELIVSGMDKFQATKNYEASAQFIKAAMVSSQKLQYCTYNVFERLIYNCLLLPLLIVRIKNSEVRGMLLLEKVINLYMD